MTKEKFKLLDKENKYISNLLEAHKEKIEKQMKVFIEPLKEIAREHGFLCCIHTHYFPSVISIYDSTLDDSNKLTIQNFKIIDFNNDFPMAVIKLVEDFIADGEES